MTGIPERVLFLFLFLHILDTGFKVQYREKEKQKMEKKIIYSNDVCSRYDYLKECRDNGEESFENCTDEDLWGIAYEMVETDLEDEMMNLDREPGGEIIIKGSLQRWNGRYSVHKALGTANLGEAMQKAMACFGGDSTIEIYVEDGKMLLTQYGHDNPVSPSVMEFLVLNRDVDADDLDPDEFEDNSFSPAQTVADIYGWDAA